MSIKERIIAAADGERSVSQVARKAGATMQYASAVCRELDLPVRRWAGRPADRFNTALAREARADRTISEIARAADAPCTTTARQLRRLGLPFRLGTPGRPGSERQA